MDARLVSFDLKVCKGLAGRSVKTSMFGVRVLDSRASGVEAIHGRLRKDLAGVFVVPDGSTQFLERILSASPPGACKSGSVRRETTRTARRAAHTGRMK